VSANVQAAQAVEPSTPVAPTTTAQAPWRERANSELEKIVQLFSSKQLPDLCAKALINAPMKPSSKWSFGNQLLMLLAGTSDARGFRQWIEVGRSVSRGSKAVYILGPVRKRVRRKVSDQAEPGEEFADVLVGFMPVPVFRYEDTAGRDLPVYEPKNPPPLLEVAERFGMKVQYERLAPGVYGAADHTNKTIVLATEDWDVFFHELGHAIHRSFEPKSGHGQEPEAETIAQLVAATLARLYGSPADSFSWSYIASYAQSNEPQRVGRLCMRVLDRTKKVLELIYPAPSA
jgi:hypothetical protein